MPVTWSDEKLILLYCPGRGSNSRPPAHRSIKHGQGVLRPYPLGHGGGLLRVWVSVVTIPNVAMRYVSRYLGHDAIRIAILVYRVSQCLDLKQQFFFFFIVNTPESF